MRMVSLSSYVGTLALHMVELFAKDQMMHFGVGVSQRRNVSWSCQKPPASSVSSLLLYNWEPDGSC